MASLVGANGQLDAQRLRDALWCAPTGLLDTSRITLALDALLQATLPTRDDVAAQSLAGTTLDAARPEPTNPRILLASSLLAIPDSTTTLTQASDGATVLATLVVAASLRAELLLPPLLRALEQLIRLTNYHAPSRELGSRLVHALLVPPSGTGGETTVAPLTYVIALLDSSRATRESGADVPTLAAFQLLTALFAFDHGKYASILAPLLPWSRSTFLRLGLLRRRHIARDTSEPSKKTDGSNHADCRERRCKS